MKEVIEENVTGLLAEPGDAQSLQAALDALLSDPAKRVSMGEAARERFLNIYTRDKLIDRTLAFYRGVLQAKPAGESQVSLLPVSLAPFEDTRVAAY
jgi:glycosyltransferase involved in cell wall biosynthesis